MDADALLLFDSCQAVPQAFDSRGKGVASAITATGWSRGSKQHSTSKPLTEVVRRVDILRLLPKLIRSQKHHIVKFKLKDIELDTIISLCILPEDVGTLSKTDCISY